MKKKSIILAFILISLFMFMPNSVKAAQFCEYNINDITSTSATLSWNCKGGDIESITLYESDCKTYGNATPHEVNPDSLFDDYTGKHDNYTADNLSSGKCYFASFKVKGGNKPDIPHVIFKTATNAETGKIISHSNTTSWSKYSDSLTTSMAESGSEINNDWAFEELGSNTTKSVEEIRATICDEDLKKDLRKYWSWFTIIGPIALIILVSLDFAKAIISGNADALKKSSTNAVKRTTAVIILLITPWLLKIIFEIVGLEEYICF